MNYNIITNQDSLGALWCIGWIFTIGYLKLTFWKGVLAIIIWPYYLGRNFSKIHTKTIVVEDKEDKGDKTEHSA